MIGGLVEWLESALGVAVANARASQMSDALDRERALTARRIEAFDQLSKSLAREKGLRVERYRSEMRREHEVWCGRAGKSAFRYAIDDRVFEDDERTVNALREFAARLP